MHGAPGKLLLVAENLIRRAEAMLENVTSVSVEQAIVGAILATDALELTGGRTPTTAIQALSLKHRFEVIAECRFLGVEYNIDVADRLKEIEIELRAISRWTHHHAREKSLMNAKTSIVTQILRIFRAFGQFDEEQLCLAHLRDLNRRWCYLRRPWLSFIAPIHWYIDWLIGSLSRFILSIFLWPVLVWAASTFLLKIDLLHSANACVVSGKPIQAQLGIFDNFYATFVSFFGLGPANWDISPDAQKVIIFLILLGFLHLGIFVSHLYTVLSRR